MVQINCCASFAQPCYTFKIRAVETTIQMKTQAKLAAIQTSNSIHGIRKHKLDLVDGNTFNVCSHNVPYLKNHVDFFGSYLIQFNVFKAWLVPPFGLASTSVGSQKCFMIVTSAVIIVHYPASAINPNCHSAFCAECCPPTSTWKKLSKPSI